MADNFYYNTKLCLSRNILKSLTEEITVKAPEKYRWHLKYPLKQEEIIDSVMLETTVFGEWDEKIKKWTGGYKRYLKISRPAMISLSPKQEELLNKYNYSGAFSKEELEYLKKWYKGTDFTGEEKTVIKNWYQNPNNPEDNCHPLDDLENIAGFSDKDLAIMKIVVYIRGFENGENILKLYAKQLKGDKLTEEESAILKEDQMQRNPTASEIARINLIKKRRGLNNFVYKNEEGSISLPITDKEISALVIFESIGQASNSVSSINLMNPKDKNKPISDTEVLGSYRRSRILTSEELATVSDLQAELNNNNALTFEIGDKVNEDSPSEFESKHSSLPGRLAWYKYVHNNISEYAGLEYWMNLTNDSLNLVVRGDASADVYPYNNWLKSYAYVGVLDPLNEESDEDKEFNWCMTVGGDTEPPINSDVNTENLSLESQGYGFRTANGVTDITVMGTRIGLPYQPHYPSFYTTNPTMDKINLDGSRWNKKKKQFSEIIVTHTFDMERGKMKNVLVGDDSNINDGDRLMYQPVGDKRNSEMYLKFKINTPYNFLQNSPNVDYCIAIRVSVDEFFNNNYCENCDYKEFAIDNGYDKVTKA